ncbi:hypothetical protein D049_3517A, partial [Vibrio parahaemolyticus VPTS-2010]
MRLSSL